MQNKDRKKGIEGVRVGLENEVSEMDRKGKNENIFRQYRRILVKTKSILCKIRTQKELPKALGSSFRVNEVEAIVRKGRKELPYAIQTNHFQQKSC